MVRTAMVALVMLLVALVASTVVVVMTIVVALSHGVAHAKIIGMLG